MNAARLSKSSRLQRVARLLKRRKRVTTMDIVQGAQVCAVNSIIAELRLNGMAITCKRKGDVWWYSLA